MIIKKIYLFICLITFFANAQTKSNLNCGPASTNDTLVSDIKINQKNVFGTPLQLASKNPLTGFFRTGFCATDKNDAGVHVIAAIITDEFLNYSKSKGNDLITPFPQNNFPGLKAGNVWCLCALRWKEAFDAGVAPLVILEATHINALKFVTLKELKSKKAN